MQNGVTITTNDSELSIVYGMMNLRKERELARASVRYILTDLNDIRRQYIRLGFHLYECSVQKYYEDFGFSTMEEFCAVNFSLDKSTVSRCIDVCLEFSSRVQWANGLKEHGSMLEIDERWNMYSYSQLVEMLPLTDEQRCQINPEMSIRQIREYKKSLKKKKDSKSVATSQPEVVYSDIYCKGISGAVRNQYYKKCKAVAKKIDIVDSEGKPVSGMYDIYADVLDDTSDHIVIRLFRKESGA